MENEPAPDNTSLAISYPFHAIFNFSIIRFGPQFWYPFSGKKSNKLQTCSQQINLFINLFDKLKLKLEQRLYQPMTQG